MILGFLGKGGSGKSSVSTQVALTLSKKAKVLAIDADHNMDLAYNLCAGEVLSELSYFGPELARITNYLGLESGKKYDKIFLSQVDKKFNLTPVDEVTAFLSKKLHSSLYLMAAGPQTDNVLYGQSCSHSLTTPLKVYLPLLNLGKDEYVVVDEKAGADGVSTGIITGIDVGVIVCEPALHSIKTALQIAELMDFYETPYVFVGNKIESSEDKDFITETLGREPAIFLLASKTVKRDPGLCVTEWSDEIDGLLEQAHALSKNNRLERTIAKFKRNEQFEENKKTC